MAQGKLESFFASPHLGDLALNCDGRGGRDAFQSQHRERLKMKLKTEIVVVTAFLFASSCGIVCGQIPISPQNRIVDGKIYNPQKSALWIDVARDVTERSSKLEVTSGRPPPAGGAGGERSVAGERELRGEELVGRCCRAALIFGPRGNAALPFLESVPEVSAKLKAPETKERKFEDVVKSAEQAAVLVLVY